MAPEPFVLRWGIVGTGMVAKTFARDLLIDPALRDETNVEHQLTGVGSRSLATAESFVADLKAASSDHDLECCTSYDSYAKLYQAEDVDVVYVATLTSLHHECVLSALKPGKHVLCEKPIARTVEELEDMITLAESKNLFLMDAMWTRFFPATQVIQRIIHSGELGKVKRLSLDFSVDYKPSYLPPDHRMISAEKGGGALLDMGVYLIHWVLLILYHHPEIRQDPKVVFAHQTLAAAGVDLNTRWLMDVGGVQASCCVGIDAHGFKEQSILITCEEGDLAIWYAPPRPLKFTIHPHHARFEGKIREKKDYEYPIPISMGTGMGFEADEVARCVRDGKLQSERMPLEETRMVQALLEDITRKAEQVE